MNGPSGRVMARLVPAIQVFVVERKMWMPSIKPGMTKKGDIVFAEIDR